MASWHTRNPKHKAANQKEPINWTITTIAFLGALIIFYGLMQYPLLIAAFLAYFIAHLAASWRNES